MNLLEMLSGSLTQEDSVNNIAKKSKSSNAQVIKLVGIALPLLVTYLTRNARKEGGTKSLAKALEQHTDTDNIATQIKDADTEDGEKILKHILGDDEDQITKNMAKQTGMDQKQVLAALDAMMPGMMSGISATASKAKKEKQNGVDLSDGIDLNDIMGMLGGSGASASAGSGLGSLLGMLGGGAQTSGGSSAAGLESLVGQFLGGTEKKAPSKKSTLDGSELINMLAGMM